MVVIMFSMSEWKCIFQLCGIAKCLESNVPPVIASCSPSVYALLPTLNTSLLSFLYSLSDCTVLRSVLQFWCMKFYFRSQVLFQISKSLYLCNVQSSHELGSIS